MDKKIQRNFLWIALLVLGTIWILARHNRPIPFQTDHGRIFGTLYNITYQAPENLRAEIDQELKRFDGSLSPFNDTATITRINRNEDIVPDTLFTNVFLRSMEISKETKGAFDITVLSPFNDTATITRINRNEDIVPDTLFTNVFLRSMEISKETKGAFDITVAPLVNAWGFGFKEGSFPTTQQVDSLLQLIGYEKVSLLPNGKIQKNDPRILITCSAIAKGYAVDVIAQLLRKKGVENFMVDIPMEKYKKTTLAY